ncbi:MAG: hypothetical protein J5802_05090 [Butyrivibrio sp.]|nr:hypothetical protein [Butyrivibrio sp.]
MKVCNRCGVMMEDNMAVCPSCQTPVDGTERMVAPAANQYAQAPQLGMKWANFLGYFALWAGAVANVLAGIPSLNAAAISPLYMILGICALVCAVFNCITAVKIINRKRDAGKFVMIVYGINVFVAIISVLIATTVTIGGEAAANPGSTFFSLVFSIVMLIVNKIYFKNRENVFVN